jgi:hypothetical protein
MGAWLTAKGRPGEGLGATAWRVVFLAFGCDKRPVIAECRREVGGAVSDDGQAGAGLGPSGAKHPKMATEPGFVAVVKVVR